MSSSRRLFSPRGAVIAWAYHQAAGRIKLQTLHPTFVGGFSLVPSRNVLGRWPGDTAGSVEITMWNHAITQQCWVKWTNPPGSPRKQPCGDCWIDTARVVNTHLCQSSQKYLTPCLNLAAMLKAMRRLFSYCIASNILSSADSEYLDYHISTFESSPFLYFGGCKSSP